MLPTTQLHFSHLILLLYMCMYCMNEAYWIYPWKNDDESVNNTFCLIVT